MVRKKTRPNRDVKIVNEVGKTGKTLGLIVEIH